MIFDRCESNGIEFKLPCGYCWNCRAFMAQQWTIRIQQEASLYENNSFITLTYAPKHLPENGTLVKNDYQQFTKNLRKLFPEIKIRYYQCGEYGDKLGRPHYHSILFGLKFPDQKYWKKSKSGNKLYISKLLNRAWTKGHAYIGSVQYESIAYVARYAMKKITGEPAENHYNGKLPEYTTMSLKPAIGLPYYDINKHSMFETGSVELNDRSVSIPQFYKRTYKKEHPESYEAFRKMRKLSNNEITQE